MIKTVIISDIRDYDKDKNGNLYVAKNRDGTTRNYVRRMIKVDGTENVLSGFKSKNNENWKSGDEVSISIEKVEKDGKTYWNFSDVKLEDRMMEMITSLQRRVSAIEALNTDRINPVRDETTTPNFDQQLDDLSGEEVPF